jgi:hypothetical protein
MKKNYFYSTGQTDENNVFLIFSYKNKHLTQIQIVIQIANEELYQMDPLPKFHRWSTGARFLKNQNW